MELDTHRRQVDVDKLLVDKNENLASPHIVSPKALTRRDTIWNRWLGDVRLPSLLFEFCAHCLVLASLHELFLALQAHVAAPSHTPVPPNSLTE